MAILLPDRARTGATLVTFKLNTRDRRALNAILTSTTDARMLRRAYALKQLDEGAPAQTVAATLQVTRQSIYNWLKRIDQQPDQPLAVRLDDGERSGRPRRLKGTIEPLIDGVIDASPTDNGCQAATWTAPLLAAYLKKHHKIVASVPSIRQALVRLNIRWKRPRHTLALRPKYWRQAKGG